MVKLKSLSTKGRHRNERVGCIGGDYMMPTSFRDEIFSTAMIRKIQTHYRTGYFTQRELGEFFNVSSGLVGKACRIMKENGGEVIA